MKPEIKYQVYDPEYLSVRISDEAFKHEAWDAVHLISSNKSLDDLFSQADRDTFVAELRDSLDPVLFPAHIGSGKLPLDHDEASGLRPGLSADRATFRGYYYDHVLKVDGKQNTMQIDDGPVTQFEPGDPDVQVVDVRGSVLYVDSGGLTGGYVGEMNVGVKGRTLRVLPTGLIVQ
ncbi:MAG: hypothetical protein H6828_14225 [Planctomycetes bacterium]|nr:hypothetical protein [Planctomycetota bacterium]